jgi:hypothetical protein
VVGVLFLKIFFTSSAAKEEIILEEDLGSGEN